jgi:hypothetical protein
VSASPRPAGGERGGGPWARLRHPTTRVAVLTLIAGALAVAIVFDLAGSSAAPKTRRTPSPGPAVPGPDTASATWYCAEGTGGPGADETILIGNAGRTDARADITVMPGGDVDQGSRRVAVPKRGQVRVPVSSVLEAGNRPDPAGTVAGPGVVVEVFGGRAVVEHEIDGPAEGERDVAVGSCARDAGRNWYFAAGTTERGAEQSIALFNPFADDAIVDLTFATDTGLVAPADLQSLAVPRRSRVSVPLGNFVRRQAQIGAHVRVRTGRVVAEQSLAFTAENETRRGLTLSLGTPAPARLWSFPGVVSGDGVGSTLYLANFEAGAAEVEVAPRFEDDTVAPATTVQVAGRSAIAVDLASLGGAASSFDVEVRATQDVPIVAEQLVAWMPPAPAVGTATALGSPVAARAWAFAVTRLTPEDGSTVGVFNPNRTSVTATLLAYASGADEPAAEREVTIEAGQQATFDVSEAGITPDQVVVVRADEPVVAARHILGASGASLAPAVPDPHAP